MTEENDLLNKLSTHSKKISEEGNIDTTHINKMIDEINSGYTQAFEEVNHTKSVQFKNLLSNVNGQINSALYINEYSKLKKHLCLINDDLKKVDIINEMIQTKRISVVVGGNGSGKSTFVNSLSNSGLKNLVVIPAQKNLFFVDSAFNREKETLKTYRPSYQKSFNVAVKEDGNDLHQAQQDIFYPFTMLITAIINDHAKQLLEDDGNKDTNSKWEDVKKIWKRIIPDISFDIESVNRFPIPVRNGLRYSFNELSDGEKCILFYIGNILVAPKNSVIVIDEPETFINPSVYNKLWDILIEERDDCRFIFTSHNIDFINGRTGATIVWCKNFIPNENHELKILNENDNLPNSLLTELLGSKKEILFCEGKRNSYDYKILSSIYIDRYTVIPVGGHDRVISYTEAVNANKDMLENKAVGIIDRDGLDDNQVNGLKKIKVHCLPYNEIEMMLIDEKIIKCGLSISNPNDKVINKIDDFQKEFFKLLKRNESRIINILLKNIIEMKLKSSFINTKKDRDVKTGFENAIKKIDVDSIEREIESNLRNVIETLNYDKALKLCPLKNEVLKDLVNKTLQADYEDFIVGVIQNNEEAQMIMGNLMSMDEW
ncbi:hypothetical protein AKUH4B507X_12180 [Apilactobacillus kunkeei]|nr:hypothetical protein AKUH3B109M_11040 [Apilactobacillus kunkeei]CAI2637471.1 hypothetical protein AKUH3B203J_11750 [Apilactobacillus kunkeei]CAI2638928.1 hypothetical protein AKUH3B101A_11720 [Apilactobacillus kunkeei]CAI2639742.1 hypothetical protein AKUH3B205J_11710 [Apilactobacillus kunkeei]CAI2639803.1 hypothetical protein AKUH3B208X_11740 [Apilactobacillus kunkeei]